MATIKKACKGTLYPKSSSVSRKLKSGGDLGMKSVKAGYDKNPGVTRADIIVAAKKQAKKGMKVKKAQMGGPVKEKEIYSKFVGPVQRPMQMQRTSKEKEAEMMKKTGKTPKKAMMGSMMKKGGKMTKKCAYGCK